MIEKELLSIPEFATAAGIAKQGIYQQIKNKNSKLFPYVVFDGDKPHIKREALKEVYGIGQDESQESKEKSKDSQDQSQEFSQDSQASSQEFGQDAGQESQEKSKDSQDQSQEPQAPQEQAQSIIVFLQEQLKEKDRQLAEKDKQIAEKDKQIENIQQILSQEQHLHARTNLLLAEYKEKVEQIEIEQADIVAAPAPTEQKQDQQQEKKVSFMERLHRFFFND